MIADNRPVIDPGNPVRKWKKVSFRRICVLLSKNGTSLGSASSTPPLNQSITPNATNLTVPDPKKFEFIGQPDGEMSAPFLWQNPGFQSIIYIGQFCHEPGILEKAATTSKFATPA